MQTVQDIALAALNKRQTNSLRGLQVHVNEVQKGRAKYRGVTAAQARAIETSLKAALASGLPLPAEVYAIAKQLGIK
jgi:hypothetical protein